MIYVSFDIGVKNLGYCIIQEQNNNVSMIDWGIITLADTKKQLKGVNNISKILFNELDNIIGKLQTINIEKIDFVIIENQPSNLNGIMKTIQYLIFSYFDLLRHWDNNVLEVILINPSLKLQNHTYIPASKHITEKLNKREKYKYNKLDSIEICQNYIKDDNILKEFFNKHKKKDDLADTCLQTISYIRKNGVLMEKIELNCVNFIT